jgi:CheY-like chemotaxis protein
MDVRPHHGTTPGVPRVKNLPRFQVIRPAAPRLRSKTKDMSALLDAPRPGAARPPDRGWANPSHRLLVVEDDVDIHEINAQVLVRFGYEVDAAEDGTTGWEALQAKKYDLLITDHCMPRLSGLEMVRKLRSARLDLAVILASGGLTREELELDRSLQLAATLFKPFTPDELLGTVHEVLRAHDRVRVPTGTLWRSSPPSSAERAVATTTRPATLS